MHAWASSCVWFCICVCERKRGCVDASVPFLLYPHNISSKGRFFASAMKNGLPANAIALLTYQSSFKCRIPCTSASPMNGSRSQPNLVDRATLPQPITDLNEDFVGKSTKLWVETTRFVKNWKVMDFLNWWNYHYKNSWKVRKAWPYSWSVFLVCEMSCATRLSSTAYVQVDLVFRWHWRRHTSEICMMHTWRRRTQVTVSEGKCVRLVKTSVVLNVRFHVVCDIYDWWKVTRQWWRASYTRGRKNKPQVMLFFQKWLFSYS